MNDSFFTLYPAIDIKDGKCVRLLFGEMEKETVYNNNPLDQAMWFVDQGAEWLHIVDLDGAVAGKNINKRVIEEILYKLQNKVKIQLGGGIRNINDIDFFITILLLLSFLFFKLSFFKNKTDFSKLEM